jgi:hypothetical protein
MQNDFNPLTFPVNIQRSDGAVSDEQEACLNASLYGEAKSDHVNLFVFPDTRETRRTCVMFALGF